MTNEGTSVRSTECIEFIELKIPGRKIVYIYFYRLLINIIKRTPEL